MRTPHTIQLTDGGVADNRGIAFFLEVLSRGLPESGVRPDGAPPFRAILAFDASQISSHWRPLRGRFRLLSRALEIAGEAKEAQRDLYARLMAERFGVRYGLFRALSPDLDVPREDLDLALKARTDLDRFSDTEIYVLAYAGFRLGLDSICWTGLELDPALRTDSDVRRDFDRLFKDILEPYRRSWWTQHLLYSGSRFFLKRLLDRAAALAWNAGRVPRSVLSIVFVGAMMCLLAGGVTAAAQAIGSPFRIPFLGPALAKVDPWKIVVLTVGAVPLAVALCSLGAARKRKRRLDEEEPAVTLYSYCLRYDDGAAPNPFFGTCTLVICKPAIRRVAEVGDWVVGLGGSASPIGDVSGQVVYAMRITRQMTMREYDQFCRVHLQGKIPDPSSPDFRRKVGDCIYDFSTPGDPALRRSVHQERNRTVDLSGANALLSEHFYYFGDRPRPLPEHLRPIVHQTQGHKSRANTPYANAFASWIESLGLEPKGLYGEPQLKAELLEDPAIAGKCSTRDLAQDEDDEVC